MEYHTKVHVCEGERSCDGAAPRTWPGSSCGPRLRCMHRHMCTGARPGKGTICSACTARTHLRLEVHSGVIGLGRHLPDLYNTHRPDTLASITMWMRVGQWCFGLQMGGAARQPLCLWGNRQGKEIGRGERDRERAMPTRPGPITWPAIRIGGGGEGQGAIGTLP